jgi:hypothetical protein
VTLASQVASSGIDIQSNRADIFGLDILKPAAFHMFMDKGNNVRETDMQLDSLLTSAGRYICPFEETYY